MNLSSLRATLEQAAADGRNVVPDATDKETRLIEGFAAVLLEALSADIEREVALLERTAGIGIVM